MDCIQHGEPLATSVWCGPECVRLTNEYHHPTTEKESK